MKTIQAKTLFIALLLSTAALSLLAEMNLFKAASQGDLDAVEKFLESGVDVNEKFYKRRAEYIYSEEEDTERWGRTALMEAAEKGHLSVVKLLLANNADHNLRPYKGLTALMEAVKGGRVGRLKVIEELIKSGAKVNEGGGKYGETALMMAVDSGRLKAAKLLLANDADPNIGWSWAEEYTPLMVAVKRNNLKMAQLLLDNDADINASTEDGVTALTHAIWLIEQSGWEQNNGAMVKLLLDNDAAINALDSRGETELMDVARYGHLKIAELLLERGADVAIKNKKGKTALEIAEEEGNTEVVKAIKDFIIRKQKALMEVEEELPSEIAKLITEFETGLKE